MATPEKRRLLLRCGVLAGPLFVATFTAHGAALSGYDARRHPVSSLALAPHGWIQTANFVVTGCLYGAFAAGLGLPAGRSSRNRLGAGLVGAAAAGLVGAGTFTTDPVSGYPPGTPDALPGYSGTPAALHDLLSVPTFLGLPAAAAVYARAFADAGATGWARYSAATATIMLANVGLATAAFSQAPPPSSPTAASTSAPPSPPASPGSPHSPSTTCRGPSSPPPSQPPRNPNRHGVADYSGSRSATACSAQQ